MSADHQPVHGPVHRPRPPYDRPDPTSDHWIDPYTGRLEPDDEWRERIRADRINAMLEELDPNVQPTELEMRVLTWLAGWEPEIPAVIASLLHRNHHPRKGHRHG